MYERWLLGGLKRTILLALKYTMDMGPFENAKWGGGCGDGGKSRGVTVQRTNLVPTTDKAIVLGVRGPASRHPHTEL